MVREPRGISRVFTKESIFLAQTGFEKDGNIQSKTKKGSIKDREAQGKETSP
jgi:hypothetical protein